MEIAVPIIFSVILFLGIILTALPTVPGMVFMFVMVVVYGLVDKFETLQPWHLFIFGGLVLLAILSDYASGLIGAKFGGASRRSLLYGIIGMVVGLIIFPPFGLFLGLFLGVLIGELIRTQDQNHALKAASYSFLGILGGMAVNVVLAIAFFIIFLFIVF